MEPATTTLDFTCLQAAPAKRSAASRYEGVCAIFQSGPTVGVGPVTRLLIKRTAACARKDRTVEQPEVGFLAQRRQRLRRKSRSHDDLHEPFGEQIGDLGAKRPVKRQHPAERGQRVAGPSGVEGLELGRAHADARWGDVFKNDRGGLFELVDGVPRPGGVEKIVVRQFLAVKLRESRFFLVGPGVKRRALVGILTIAQILDLAQLDGELLGNAASSRLGAQAEAIIVS